MFVPRRPKHLAGALEDLQEPVDVDEVEDDAGRDQDIPDAAKLDARQGAVDRVHFVPVWWNACDAHDEEHERHGDTVQEEHCRRLRVAEHVEKPPVESHKSFTHNAQGRQMLF